MCVGIDRTQQLHTNSHGGNQRDRKETKEGCHLKEKSPRAVIKSV